MSYGIKSVSNLIKIKCEEHLITKVTYRQWESTDRCNLNVHCDDIKQFLLVFENSLKKLITNDFKTTQQYEFVTHKKRKI